MKILVLGGTHGNEPLGPKLVANLSKNPIPGVDTIIGNSRAVQKNCRFIQKDLNRSFPGDVKSPIYEERRAAQIAKICQEYDLVLDFHNTLTSENDCVFVGESANPLLKKVANYLDLKRVIVADYDCINKYVPRCISLEISVDSKRMSIRLWRKLIADLALLENLPTAKGLNLYRYVATITTEQSNSLSLTKRDLRVFEPLPKDIVLALGAKMPAYPIFIGKNYTKGVYAGILNKIET